MIKKKKILVAEEMPEFKASINALPAENRIFVDKSLEIADYIFRLMEQNGMKQKDLAEKMGKSEAEVSKILGGMHNLTLRSIAKLEAALDDDVICIPNKVRIVYQVSESHKMEGKVTSQKEHGRNKKMEYGNPARIVSISGMGSDDKIEVEPIDKAS